MGKNRKIGCKTFKRYIGDYIDNEISPELQHDLEKHMEICVFCNNIYKGFLTLGRRLKKLDSIQASSDFKRKLLNRIHEETQPSGNSFNPFKANVLKIYKVRIFWPAFAVLVITISFFLMKTHITPFFPFQQVNSKYISSLSMKYSKSPDEVSIYIDDHSYRNKQQENKPTNTIQAVSENLLIIELDESIAQYIIF